MSVNKMIMIGNLGADPETKDVNGKLLCTFSIATNEKWTDKSGEKQERTEWTNCTVWGKLGETCAKYLKKGRQVYVEGRKQTRTYEDKDGIKRYFTEMVVNECTFLGDRPADTEGGSRSDRGGGGGGRNDGPPPGAPTPGSDDDIPF